MTGELDKRQEEKSSPAQVGVIAGLLMKDGLISEQQLAYALRVSAKLTTQKTIKDIFLDLGYVTPEQLQESMQRHKLNVRLGDLLVELGYMRGADLQQALGMQKDSGGTRRLGEILIEGGFIEERKLLETLSYQLGYPLIELDFVKLDKSLFAVIPLNVCRDYNIVPVSRDGNKVVVAFSDPLDRRALAVVERYLGNDTAVVIAPKEAVLNALNAIERSAEQSPMADEGSVIGMINALFEQAIEDQASDIHIEPMKDRLRVRFRRDGVMEQYKDYPKEIAAQLSSRIKVMAHADIAEKRRH